MLTKLLRGTASARNESVNINNPRVGLSIPPSGFSSYDDAVNYVTSAAESGLDHLITADHVAFQGGRGIDGLTLVSWLAGLQPTLDVYVGVYLLALRHPVTVARQISTLSELSPGRLTFGVGVGGEDRHEMEVVGVDPATRGRRTDEALKVLRSLLEGLEVNHYGEFYSAPDVSILPVPSPPVPITIGGRSDAAIARTGLFGDGWLASWCSPERFSAGVHKSEEIAKENGRMKITWRHGYQIWVGFGDTPEEGKKVLGPAMERFYGTPFSFFEKYSPVGSPSDIAQWLKPFIESGAKDLNIAPIASSPSEAIAGMAELRKILVS